MLKVADEREILGTSTISTGYLVRLPDKVKKLLEVNIGDVVGMHYDKHAKHVILRKLGHETWEVLAAPKLSKSKNLTLVGAVRKKIPVEIGKKLLFVKEIDGLITIHTQL